MTKKADGELLAKAQRILRSSPLIDGHNDLPWQFREHSNDLSIVDLRLNAADSPLKLLTDFPRLHQGCLGGQFWSVYIPGTLHGPEAVEAVLEQIDVVHRLVRQYPDQLELALTADDIERIFRKGRIASLIGMEGGHSIDNSLAMLRMTYALGARYMTLTHSENNDWADSATDKPAHHGLTAFGEQVVREMNRLGMLVDLSHVSDETMRAALKVTRAPVIFSHSSARAVCSHPRNVPDDILKLTAANGGVVMVCFMPGYVSNKEKADLDEWQKVAEPLKKQYPGDSRRLSAAREAWRKSHPSPEPATLSDVADHIDHIRQVAGIDHIGIGSDFEGYHGALKGLEDVSCYPALMAELLRRGYSERDIKKVAGLNVIRALRAAEEVSRSLERELKKR